MSEKLDPKAMGEWVNELTLDYIRGAEDVRGLRDARLSKKLNTSRQQIARLRKTIKVLTLPLLIQWCVGRRIDPGNLITDMMKHARENSKRKK